MPIDLGKSPAALAGGVKLPKLGGAQKLLGGAQGLTVAQTKRFLSDAYAFLLAMGATDDFASFDLGAAIQQRIDELSKSTDVHLSQMDRVARLSLLITQVAQQAGSFDQTELGAGKLADMSATYSGVAGVGAKAGDAFAKVQSVVNTPPVPGALDGVMNAKAPDPSEFVAGADLEDLEL